VSKARLVITAVVVEGRPVAQVAADYGVSRQWINKLDSMKDAACLGPRRETTRCGWVAHDRTARCVIKHRALVATGLRVTASMSG
jgi:hypothetical protein